jgi:hypothetical protein
MLHFSNPARQQDSSSSGIGPCIQEQMGQSMDFLLVLRPIPVIGIDAKREEVTTYDLASRMIDLDVDLAPELTKASLTSASTSTYFQATHVITTRDALEEFVAVDG